MSNTEYKTTLKFSNEKLKISLKTPIEKLKISLKMKTYQWPSKILGTYDSEYKEIDQYILDTIDQRILNSNLPMRSYIAYGDISFDSRDTQYIIKARDISEAFIKMAKFGNSLFYDVLKEYFTALNQSFEQWIEDCNYRPTLKQLISAIENAPRLDMDSYLVEI